MVDRIHDGKTKVWAVTTIADPAAPTVAEITAGDDITAFITKDGLRTPSTRDFADTGSLAATVDTEVPASKGGRVSLTCKRGTPDTAWDLFQEGAALYIVVGRDSPTPAAADIVEVYQVESHEPAMMDSAKNEVQKFTVELGIVAAWERDAVVAA